jgi:hypothetical protein
MRPAARLREIRFPEEEFIFMATKKKTKRLAKGQRTHIRRLKQEARIAGTVYRPGIQ